MPIGAGAGAIIAAGVTAAGSGANAYAQGKMNRKTREWNEKQYHRQRADSLKDWAMVNEYNSPAAQMARYRDAGLNPHLIYGQSNTSDAVRSADTPQWNPRAPQLEFNAGGIMGQYFDANVKAAQIDNLKTQNTVATQEAILKAAQTAGMNIKNASDEFSLQQAKRLADTSAQAAEANLKKLNTDIAATEQGMDIATQENARRAAQNTQSLEQGIKQMIGMDIDNLNKKKTGLEIEARTRQSNAATSSIRSQIVKTEQEIKNLRESLKAIENDNDVRKLDIELKRAGIQPGDNILMRVYFQFLHNMRKAAGSSPKPGQNWNMVIP